MKRFLPLLFAFLMLVQLVGAFNALEKLDQNQTYLCICTSGDATLRYWTPPENPFNDTSLQELYVIMPYNKTHVWTVFYSPGGSKTEKLDRYYPRTPRVPFNLSDWNLSKVIKEYQWGLKNYLPNVTGEYWHKGYWNSTITRWEVELNATTFKMTLYGGHCGECEQYITFECWRDGTNVTCRWEEPVFKAYHNVPPIGKETTESKSTAKEENKICGPALLVELTLISLLIVKRGK